MNASVVALTVFFASAPLTPISEATVLSIQLSNPVLPWLAKVCFCSCAWVLTLRVLMLE